MCYSSSAHELLSIFFRRLLHSFLYRHKTTSSWNANSVLFSKKKDSSYNSTHKARIQKFPLNARKGVALRAIPAQSCWNAIVVIKGCYWRWCRNASFPAISQPTIISPYKHESGNILSLNVDKNGRVHAKRVHAK